MVDGLDPGSERSRIYPESHLKDNIVSYGYSPFTKSLFGIVSPAGKLSGGQVTEMKFQRFYKILTDYLL